MVTSGYLHAEASKARGIEEKIKRTFEKLLQNTIYICLFLHMTSHDVGVKRLTRTRARVNRKERRDNNRRMKTFVGKTDKNTCFSRENRQIVGEKDKNTSFCKEKR